MARASRHLQQCGGIEEALFEFTPCSPAVNPAVLTSTVVHYDKATARNRPNLQVSRSLQHPLPGESDNLARRIGVSWLFGDGAASACLAEVFSDGLPDSRLPYCSERAKEGHAIARVLGRDIDFVRLVPEAATRLAFSQGCELLPMAFPCIRHEHILMGSPYAGRAPCRLWVSGMACE